MILNSRKRKKINISIDNYRDDEAYDHQEVVTPPELVELIYSYLDEEDFDGEILDPCVGPGAMSIPLLRKKGNLTVCDIQSLHIEDFQRISDGTIVDFVGDKPKQIEWDDW